jgi:DNA invertase Pin-like site-specific DNA recombinase
MKKIIGYARVSSKKQVKGGSLKSQKAALQRHAAEQGLQLLEIYHEQDHGDSKHRPQLAMAIAHARSAGAELVVARLDRLTRCYHILRDIEESGLVFTALDNPHASRMTVHIMCVIAEQELQNIKERVTRGVRDAIASGAKWGNPQNLTEAARRKGQTASARDRMERADEYDQQLKLKLKEWEGQSLAWIAAELNRCGWRTAKGGLWHPASVWRVINRDRDRKLQRRRRQRAS